MLQGTEVQTSGRVQEQAHTVVQQLDFNLRSLRASLTRQREAGGGVQAPQQGTKKGRFEAASLQVSTDG